MSTNPVELIAAGVSNAREAMREATITLSNQRTRIDALEAAVQSCIAALEGKPCAAQALADARAVLKDDPLVSSVLAGLRRETTPTQVYATIKRSSEYRYQHNGKTPFPVGFGDFGSHVVLGNGNHYRISDLRLSVKIGDRFVALS